MATHRLVKLGALLLRPVALLGHRLPHYRRQTLTASMTDQAKWEKWMVRSRKEQTVSNSANCRSPARAQARPLINHEYCVHFCLLASLCSKAHSPSTAHLGESSFTLIILQPTVTQWTDSWAAAEQTSETCVKAVKKKAANIQTAVLSIGPAPEKEPSSFSHSVHTATTEKRQP